MDVGQPITAIPIPLQAYVVTSITTMYRYLHKRNHLCNKNKLILNINGNKKQLTQKRESDKIVGDGSYPPTKVPVILQ